MEFLVVAEAVGAEGAAAGEHFVHDEAEGVDVGADGDAAAGELFGGHIGGCAGAEGFFDGGVKGEEELATGKELFEKLKCQQCHVLGAIPKDQPTANLAPDLRMVPDRLQPDWILDWLKAPAAILPGTRMPAFWPDYPKSAFPHLNGDAAAQILAIRNHLLTFRGGPTPRGNASSEKSAN